MESTKGTDIVLGSTERANYTGSYTTVSKEIVDVEIGMYQSAGIIGTRIKPREDKRKRIGGGTDQLSKRDVS